ncbi:MAG: MarR family winged helix-turn-helix transcriptional regulator [Thermotogota bacterium]
MKYIGRKISCVFRNSHNFFDQVFEEFHIGRGQMHYFMYIVNHGNGMSQEEITQALEIDKATTTRALRKLEKNEYIIRKSDEKDKRKKRVFLTEKGEQIKDELKKTAEIWEKKLLEGIPEEKVEVFLEVLEKMKDNMINEKNKVGVE